MIYLFICFTYCLKYKLQKSKCLMTFRFNSKPFLLTLAQTSTKGNVVYYCHGLTKMMKKFLDKNHIRNVLCKLLMKYRFLSIKYSPYI